MGRRTHSAIEDTTFRVYFHNIKGLHLQRTSSDLIFNLESMRDIEAIVFGWAETNTNWNQEDAHQAEYRGKASQVFQMNKTVFSSSDMPSASMYKPGGIAMTLTDK